MAQATTRGGLLGTLMLTNRQLKIEAVIAVVAVLSAIAGGATGASLLGSVVGAMLLVRVLVLVGRGVKAVVGRVT